jgi:3-hydroxy-D-aspartate aldolase
MKVSEIPTPALLVDVDAMDRNIERMAAYFAQRSCKLRPHFKAHKTPAIARRQLAAGQCTGLTCATAGEAEVVVREGVSRDVLIANEVVGAGKAQRVARLAKSANVMVAVDSDDALDDIAAAAREQGSEVGVLVEVNIGHRCGVAPGEPAVALAKRAVETAGVRFRGAMGYEGHVMPIADRAEREQRAHRALDRLLSSVRMMREEGLGCDIVSAGGTCTFDITGALEGVTEIQAGTYVLMDTAYRYDDLPFELALSVLGSVVSRPRADVCIADNGHKSCTTDHGNPAVKGIDGASVVFMADEHALITLPPDATLAPGDLVELYPSHIDPTINLHDAIYAVRGVDVVEVWPIAARGYPEHRATVE